MPQTDFSTFLLTLSPEEQEFVATHKLASYQDRFNWEAYVPAGLVPQAIACYIQRKLIRYLDEQLCASSGEVREVIRPEKKKKKMRRITSPTSTQ